jgi:hypothetical protein
MKNCPKKELKLLQAIPQEFEDSMSSKSEITCSAWIGVAYEKIE